MYERKIKEDLDCGITVTMKVIGAKWKPCIIDAINQGYHRPSEIHRALPGTSLRVIEMQLSELAGYGLVDKERTEGFPLCVKYNLTPLGKSLLPVIAALDTWGTAHKDEIKESHEKQLAAAGLAG